MRTYDLGIMKNDFISFISRKLFDGMRTRIVSNPSESNLNFFIIVSHVLHSLMFIFSQVFRPYKILYDVGIIHHLDLSSNLFLERKI